MKNKLTNSVIKLPFSPRRPFLQKIAITSVGLIANAASPSRVLGNSPKQESKKILGPKFSSETLVTTLYQSLSDKQKTIVHFPFDHPLRSKVDNNWQITPVKIKDLFTPDQQMMIKEIFGGLHNPEYLDKVMKHMQEDGNGLENYTVAIFGLPGTGKFEFVLTGRHCTMRCDGDSVEGSAFGGPIFYGHASQSFTEAPDHPGNVYWYQAKSANQVFQALDPKQRNIALLKDAPAEQGTQTVKLRRGVSELDGLPVAEMSSDQKDLVEKVLSDLLLPFRRKDALEALKYIKKNGGFRGLRMSFYKNDDLGNDGIWDMWKLESDNMIWFFRGSPHVHVWVNVKA